MNKAKHDLSPGTKGQRCEEHSSRQAQAPGDRVSAFTPFNKTKTPEISEFGRWRQENQESKASFDMSFYLSTPNTHQTKQVLGTPGYCNQMVFTESWKSDVIS